MRSWKTVVFAMGAVSVASTAVFAEEAVAATAGMPGNLKMWLAIAAGFGMAIASVGGALGQSKAISAAVDGIARNPGAAGKIFAPTLIVGLALIESLVLLSFVVASGLASKI